MAEPTGATAAPPRSPREVFMALVTGVAEGRFEGLADLYAEQTDVVHPFDPFRAPPLRSRDELRAHFTPPEGVPAPTRRPVNITVHETADPEVIIAEFEYRGTAAGTGDPISVPAVFVMRVRDGRIVSSRDYIDHLASARSWGRLDELLSALA